MDDARNKYAPPNMETLFAYVHEQPFWPNIRAVAAAATHIVKLLFSWICASAWKIIILSQCCFARFFACNQTHTHMYVCRYIMFICVCVCAWNVYSLAANFYKQTCKLQNVLETQNLLSHFRMRHTLSYTLCTYIFVYAKKLCAWKLLFTFETISIHTRIYK